MLEGWVTAAAERIPELSFLLAIVAPAIGGELAVLGLAFLAGQGYFPIVGIIAGSFVGMVLLDAFWFLAPRSRWGLRMKEKMRVSERYRTLERRIESLTHRSDIIILLISKVLIGTRILILAYLSIRTISFTRFLAYNSAATAVWAAILGVLGYFAGLGYYNAAYVYNQAAYGVAGIALAVGAFYGTLFLIRRWISTKEN